MESLFYSKYMGSRAVKLMRFFFCLLGTIITVYTMWFSSLYIFAYMTNLSVIVATLYFGFAS
jgi:hypothetical protein